MTVEVLTDAEWKLMFFKPAWTKEVEQALSTDLRKAFNLHIANMDKMYGFDRAAVQGACGRITTTTRGKTDER